MTVKTYAEQNQMRFLSFFERALLGKALNALHAQFTRKFMQCFSLTFDVGKF